jgi:GNAT superfamily N-acetyltransferase
VCAQSTMKQGQGQGLGRLVTKEYLHFKTLRTEPFRLASNDDAFIIAGLAGIIRHWSILRRWSTILARCNLMLKIAIGRDIFFGIYSTGNFVSSGILALGHCRYYKIGPGEVVISTINTDPKRRGEGLAVKSIKVAMNVMIERGHTQFYIDTTRDNIAMQHAIEKLGFGPPYPVEKCSDMRVRQMSDPQN